MQETMENDFKWYAVQTRNNKENAAKERLQKEIEILGRQEFFKNIYVPMLATTNEGTKKKTVSPLLKGTLFINCNLTSQTQGLIVSQPDIFGFIGGIPTPISEEELMQMIKETGCTDFEGNISVTNKFNVGDEVTIVGTDFEGLKGVVAEFNKNHTRATVNIQIFKKPMAVEFETSQLKKV
jgi:transcription antitermination factor NusG